MISALAFLVLSGSGPNGDMKVVARGLGPEDLEAATKGLDEKKIVYKLGDDGSILVAPDKIHDAAWKPSKTMPSGKAVGFEVFDEGGMGRARRQRKVNCRAPGAELARTSATSTASRRARPPGDARQRVLSA
ncbi:MAG: hypothetical protein U1F43_33950 [Myxococcota bacterium]